MIKAAALMLCFLFFYSFTKGLTTNTTGQGVWNNAGNWSSGVPGGNDDANVNHIMTINTNITIGQGDYIINQPVTDIAGGTAYNLQIGGSGGNNGLFDVNANATFEGTCNVTAHGRLIIRSGDTLIVGATVFSNNSYVLIEAGGVLIVNGNLTNSNNSDDIIVNGLIIVNGNFFGGNGSTITGTGGMTTTGSLTTAGSGSVFGSTDDCPTGPCFGPASLPIELLDFSATVNGNVVKLTWTTLSEINNDYFTIDRSVDMQNFEHLLDLPGAGNSRQKITYQTIDPMPLTGNAYYRLKQTDYDGKYAYEGYVAVFMELKSGKEILVFPNPAKDFVNVSTPSLLFDRYEIRSSDGKLIMSEYTGERQFQLSTINWPEGIYRILFFKADIVTGQTAIVIE